jgi:hypothetical protein
MMVVWFAVIITGRLRFSAYSGSIGAHDGSREGNSIKMLKISSPEARWWRLPQPTAIRWTQIERYTVIGNLLLIEL